MNEFKQAHQRLKQDIAYYESNQSWLLEQHPEQWVAVYEQQVVGVDADLRRLLTTVKEQGVPPGRALVEYLSKKDEVLILRS